jgi:hypothetical protein
MYADGVGDSTTGLDLDGLDHDGFVIAPEAVLVELERQNDELHDWVKARRESIVQATSG